MQENISYLSYSERLATLNLPTVYRRIIWDMIEAYKILNNMTAKLQIFFQNTTFLQGDIT